MKHDYYRRQNCRLCHSSNLELVLPLAATPVGDAYVSVAELGTPQPTYPNELFFCQDCTHAQLLDVIDPDILYGNFTYTTSISLGLVEHFQNYSNEALKRLKPAPGSLVVDLGSNDGTLLRGFQQGGMQVLGVDPAQEIAALATAAGIKTIPAYFNSELGEKLRAEQGAATIITSNNTFANIDDLSDFLAGVNALLADDGVLIVETGYVVEQIKNGVFDNIYHEHISYFSANSMQRLLPRHNLELFDLQLIDTKGGSIRFYIQRQAAGRPQSEIVENLCAQELAAGFGSTAPYLQLADQIKAAGQQLREHLEKLRQQGARIAGFGASVGTTTLLYEFALDPYLDFLVDDNPIKHNRFSPGHHIPVFGPQALKEKQPEYLVILPWRYAEPIMQKHADFKQQGGQFILPWPKLEVN